MFEGITNEMLKAHDEKCAASMKATLPAARKAAAEGRKYRGYTLAEWESIVARVVARAEAWAR